MASSDALARAVGHPLRVRILAALDDGPCGLEALARRVEAEPRTTARHSRILEQAGLVGRRRTGRTTAYHLTTPLAFSDDEYGALAPASREAAVAAALAHCHTAAASALEGGGFDRSDVHLSRTSIEVTEAQWRELSGELARLLERIETLAEPGEDDEERTSASAVLMLFERPASASPHEHHEAGPYSATEGLERSWVLSERLERALSAPATDWTAVVALADQLRVLARGALNDEIRDARDASVRAGVPAS
jgi:DNA-binding transcriptional ArsR family regulator